MLENIRLSFQGIWSHKMRSFLTMLGIIIGIASIISIVSTIKGTNEQIKQNLVGAGNNNVDVKLNQGGSEAYMDQGITGVLPLTEDQKERIRNLDHVEHATFYRYRTYFSAYYGNKSMDGNLRGVDTEYLTTCGYVLKEGRNFIDQDYTDFHKVAILDDIAARTLFNGESALGKTIELGAEPFTVVGVIQKSDSFQPVINSYKDYMTYSGEQLGSVLIPTDLWPVIYVYDEPEHATVMAERVEDMSQVGKETEEIMNESIIGGASTMEEKADSAEEERVSTGNSNGYAYKAADLLEKARSLQEVSQSTNQQLLWIASISLLVGGIGVMNIMLVSVTERTSEIGLKKAIGARKRKILGQFLTEAAVLTSIGGILGVIVGIVLAQVISKISGAPVAVSIPAVIGSVLFSMASGVVFGLLPSVKAANLNPIDALRYE